MKGIILFIALLFTFSISGLSQSTNAYLSVYQNIEIEQLVEKHKKVNEVNYELDGWRVQIFSAGGTGSSDKANLAKAEFLNKFPDAKVYIVFNAPYFKVRIGNYRTKIEALYYIQEIKKEYPFAFAVIDKIEPPEL